MNDLEWLDGYSGQTTEQLLALDGRYRIDSLVLAFEQAIDQKASKVGVEGLTVEERTVLAVEALEREVNNGGYWQFFRNASTEFAPTIVEALSRIGCPQTAKITQNAIEALDLDRLTQTFESAIAVESEGRDDALAECDDAYFCGAEHLDAALFRFIRDNQDHINLC